MRYDSFRPGKEWRDTEGKLIQAHGGSVIYLGDTFYWYGENKENTKPDNDIWHWESDVTVQKICITGKMKGS